MRFQSNTHILPLLTIESPVAQWLEHPRLDHRGLWVQIPSGTQIFFRVKNIPTLKIPDNTQYLLNRINYLASHLQTPPFVLSSMTKQIAQSQSADADYKSV